MVLTKNCKKFVCILLAAACCLPLLSCSGSDFQTVSCPYSLRQIAMPDKNTGWGLSMENELLFTTDGVEHFETVRRYETALSTALPAPHSSTARRHIQLSFHLTTSS